MRPAYDRILQAGLPLGAACYAGIRTNLLIPGTDKMGHPVIAVLVSIVLILASGIALSLRSLTPAIRRLKRTSGVYISFFLYYMLLLIPGTSERPLISLTGSGRMLSSWPEIFWMLTTLF